MRFLQRAIQPSYSTVNTTRTRPRFAAASFGGTGRLLDARSGETITEFTHDNWVYDIDVHPDGTKVVTPGRDFVAKLWMRETGVISPFSSFPGRLEC